MTPQTRSADLTPREAPEDYARRMADKTRKVHVITGVGNVFALVGNEGLIEDCGGIAATFRPTGALQR